MNLAKLEVVNQAAMLEASKALSKFLKSPVSIGMPVVEVKKAPEVARTLPSEEVVVGISMRISSDVVGNTLLVLPKETALAFSDFLLKRERGTTRLIQAEEQSVLEEVGNIVVGNYLTAFSQGFGLKSVLHGAPRFLWDQFGSLVKQVVPTLVSGDPEEALLIEVRFTFEQATVKGYMILIFQGGGAALETVLERKL